MSNPIDGRPLVEVQVYASVATIAVYEGGDHRFNCVGTKLGPWQSNKDAAMAAHEYLKILIRDAEAAIEIIEESVRMDEGSAIFVPESKLLGPYKRSGD